MKTALRAQRTGLSFLAGLFVCSVVAFAATDHSWLRRVSDKDRQRSNPYAAQPDAVAAGAKLYGEHCSKCHGDNLEGTDGKPALHSDTVQHAADGELFWILKNGDLRHGMPSWSTLPEPSRWQLIAFLRNSNQMKL